MVAFSHVKEQFTFQKVIELLSLQGTWQNGQWRGPCPACKQGGNRTLVITPPETNPQKNGFYCWNVKRGGDQLNLVAHLKSISTKDAAEWLAGAPEAKEKVDGLPALDHLQHEHERVQLILSAESAISYGVGYTSRGFCQKTVAVPLFTTDGSRRLGYLGIEEDGEYRIYKDVPKYNVIFNAHNCKDREVRLLGRVEDVLHAYDVGLDAVCFLTPTVNGDQLRLLAQWLDDNDKVLAS